MTPPPTLSHVAICDRPVRIAVLVARRDTTDAATVSLTGSVRSAVRAAFAHPRLVTALQTVQMDADRLIDRIVSRWENPKHENDVHQMWEKSDGSTTVRWWVDRQDALAA